MSCVVVCCLMNYGCGLCGFGPCYTRPTSRLSKTDCWFCGGNRRSCANKLMKSALCKNCLPLLLLEISGKLTRYTTMKINNLPEDVSAGFFSLKSSFYEMKRSPKKPSQAHAITKYLGSSWFVLKFIRLPPIAFDCQRNANQGDITGRDQSPFSVFNTHVSSVPANRLFSLSSMRGSLVKARFSGPPFLFLAFAILAQVFA